MRKLLLKNLGRSGVSEYWSLDDQALLEATNAAEETVWRTAEELYNCTPLDLLHNTEYVYYDGNANFNVPTGVYNTEDGPVTVPPGKRFKNSEATDSVYS